MLSVGVDFFFFGQFADNGAFCGPLVINFILQRMAKETLGVLNKMWKDRWQVRCGNMVLLIICRYVVIFYSDTLTEQILQKGTFNKILK